MITKSVLKRGLCGALMALPLAMVNALPSRAQNLYVDVYNAASSTITGVYVSPNYSGSWGNNILSNVVPPGGVLEIDIMDGLSTCIYDVYIVYADGGDYRQDRVDMCNIGTFTVTD